MEKNVDTQDLFDFEAEVGRLLASAEVQKSLSRPGAKESLIAYLRDEERAGSAGTFEVDENDAIVADMIFGLLTTYAFLAAHARFSSDPAVNHYMELFGKMYEGHDVHQELDEATKQLPEAFKSTVNEAGRAAQEYLIERLLAYQPS